MARKTRHNNATQDDIRTTPESKKAANFRSGFCRAWTRLFSVPAEPAQNKTTQTPPQAKRRLVKFPCALRRWSRVDPLSGALGIRLAGGHRGVPVNVGHPTKRAPYSADCVINVTRGTPDMIITTACEIVTQVIAPVASRADVRCGSKAEKLRLSKCLLLFPKQRTFIKATAANSTRIDAARNKPPHPELIDKFADWLIALSSGGLFVFNSNF